MRRTKQYFRFRVCGNRIEFHTGTDRESVRAGECMNRSIRSVPDSAKRVPEWLQECMNEVELHDLEYVS